MSVGHIPAPGKGVLFVNDKKSHPKAPDWKGTLMLSQDYKAGEIVKIGAWAFKTPKGTLLSLNEDTWKPDGVQQYPKPLNDDEVPF
jgi:hypothetical protein